MLLWFLPLAATVFAAAILRGLTGFGFALAAVPLISLAIEPKVAVASTVLLQVMVGVPDLIRLRGSYDRAEVIRLSLGALAGVPFGIAALARLDANATRLAIALISLIGALPAAAAGQIEDDAAADIASDVGTDLRDSTQSVMQDYLAIRPVIHVDQGTRITVMVDRDLEIF